MKKKDSFSLIVYIISFVIIWICYIFWIEKNEFDLEFRERKIATATIFNIGTDEVVQELYEGRKTNVYEINYIQYSYNVNGKKYESGSNYYGGNYSISDKIDIEYVTSNPLVSKIKGQNEYSFNYFIRNLISVSFFSIIVMLCFFGILNFFTKSEILNRWYDNQ